MISGHSKDSSKGKSFAARSLMIPGIGLAAVLIAYAGATIRPAQADAPKPAKTTEQGVYTEAQAKQGKTSYTQNCATCHFDDLSGSGQALPLAGDSFMQSWEGQTVDDLFEVIHDTMPQDKPGTLTPEAKADVISYILKFNKFPAGQRNYRAIRPPLKTILITTKKPAGATPAQPPSATQPPPATPPPAHRAAETNSRPNRCFAFDFPGAPSSVSEGGAFATSKSSTVRKQIELGFCLLRLSINRGFRTGILRSPGS